MDMVNPDGEKPFNRVGENKFKEEVWKLMQLIFNTSDTKWKIYKLLFQYFDAICGALI